MATRIRKDTAIDYIAGRGIACPACGSNVSFWDVLNAYEILPAGIEPRITVRTWVCRSCLGVWRETSHLGGNVLRVDGLDRLASLEEANREQ